MELTRVFRGCILFCICSSVGAQTLHLSSGFPDFGWMVAPEEYAKHYTDQPLFRLKTDFPAVLPKQLPSAFEIDFRAEPQNYIEAIRDYVFEGNVPAFGGEGAAWDPYANPVRQWYHIPWLHPPAPLYPPDGGTEGFRGLTKEAQVMPLQLSEHQRGDYQVYAITLVNDFAGYTLGKMWQDADNPDPSVTDRRYGGGFPPGTIFAKLLFTDAPAKPGDSTMFPEDYVEFLNNPIEWTAYITQQWCEKTGPTTCSGKRAALPVRLLQMDLMIRDPRANDYTGWVFGTYVYNGAVNNPKSRFLNLVPLGVQWGNEPENIQNRTNPYPPIAIESAINPDLTQQVVFATPNTPKQHLGWNGRLNGPADLNTSSCMSCHTTAQYPALTPLIAEGMMDAGKQLPPVQGGSKVWMEWFQNVPAATSINRSAYSTDMSLQVAMALTNFYLNKERTVQGMWADLYHATVPISRGGHPPETSEKRIHQQ